jgi:hypothetical protein
LIPFFREKKISQKTYDRVKVAQNYIEKKYRMKKQEEEEKRKGIINIKFYPSRLEFN